MMVWPVRAGGAPRRAGLGSEAPARVETKVKESVLVRESREPGIEYSWPGVQAGVCCLRAREPSGSSGAVRGLVGGFGDFAEAAATKKGTAQLRQRSGGPG